ncbi:MAG: hypothetical protein IH627_16605 [Rubrivivax sp.]|nr:hypothetical protein [Rubrivivax sp.]
MTDDKKRVGGGGKLGRTETVTVRLDPKLRYLTELAARKHSRTVSSYIEWRLKMSLDSEDVRPVDTPAHVAAPETIGSEGEYLWDVDEADRFAKLALRYPHLLTHEEQVRWKLIRENGALWKGSYGGPKREWMWTVKEDSFVFLRLREHWATFCRVADTGGSKDELPKWARTDPNPPPARPPYGAAPPPLSVPPKSTTGFEDMDDDIPF